MYFIVNMTMVVIQPNLSLVPFSWKSVQWNLSVNGIILLWLHSDREALEFQLKSTIQNVSYKLDQSLSNQFSRLFAAARQQVTHHLAAWIPCPVSLLWDSLNCSSHQTTTTRRMSLLVSAGLACLWITVKRGGVWSITIRDVSRSWNSSHHYQVRILEAKCGDY